MKRNPFIRKPILLIIALVLALILPDLSLASEPFTAVPSYTATFLRFPRGTRSISLGGCGAADPSTPLNTYYNPAVAFSLDRIHAVQGYNEWPLDIDLQDYGVYTGRSFRLGTNSRLLVGGGVRYTHLRLDAHIPDTIFLPGGTGRIFQAKDYYLTMTAAGGVSTHWADAGIGLSAKPVNVGVGEVNDWFWAFDTGLLVKFNVPEVSGVRIVPTGAVSILNFNEDVEFDDRIARLPDEIRLGAGLLFESPASKSFEQHLGIRGPVASLTFLYEHMDRRYMNGKDGDNYGAELTLMDAFSMRVGHSDQIFGGLGGTTYGMGFGWWFRSVRVQFDVASFPTLSFLGDGRNNSYGVSIIADL
jgi:hypothetical protein